MGGQKIGSKKMSLWQIIIILIAVFFIWKLMRKTFSKSIEEILEGKKDPVKKTNQPITKDQPKYDKYGNEIEINEYGWPDDCLLNSEIEITKSQIETMFVNAMEVTEGELSTKLSDESITETAFLFWIDRLKDSGEFEGFLFPTSTYDAIAGDPDVVDDYVGMFFNNAWAIIAYDEGLLKDLYDEYIENTENIDKLVDRYSKDLKNNEAITQNNEILFWNNESHIPILEGSSDGPEKGKKYVKDWTDDKEKASAKIKANGMNLQYLSDSLKADKELVLAAVRKSGYNLEYASDSLKADKEVVLAALVNDGFAYNYVDDSLKADREVIEAALLTGEPRLILDRIPESIEGYRELMLEYIKKDNNLFSFVGKSLEDDEEFLEIVGDDSFKAFLNRREQERAEDDMENESAEIEDDEDEEEVIEIK